MFKILIADDHPIVRQGIVHLISTTREFVVKGEASCGSEVISMLEARDFDILVLDLSMPGLSGSELIMQVKKTKPDVKILILSRFSEDQYAIPMLKAGACGYVCKTSVIDELVLALTKISQGKIYVSSHLSENLALFVKGEVEMLPHLSLSEREKEVMQMIVDGKRISDIAKELHLSQTTVSTYRSRILEKMHMESDADMIRYSIENDTIK